MMLHSLSNSFVLVSFAGGGTPGAPSQGKCAATAEVESGALGNPRPAVDRSATRPLTKHLELTANQRSQIRPLLEKHHKRIQALLDVNPTISREALEPQIHVISDQTQTKLIIKLKRC